MVTHERGVLPQQLDRRVRESGKDRERAGQIDLIDPGEYDRRDSDVVFRRDRNERKPFGIEHRMASSDHETGIRERNDTGNRSRGSEKPTAALHPLPSPRRGDVYRLTTKLSGPARRVEA